MAEKIWNTYIYLFLSIPRFLATLRPDPGTKLPRKLDYGFWCFSNKKMNPFYVLRLIFKKRSPFRRPGQKSNQTSLYIGCYPIYERENVLTTFGFLLHFLRVGEKKCL